MHPNKQRNMLEFLDMLSPFLSICRYQESLSYTAWSTIRWHIFEAVVEGGWKGGIEIDLNEKFPTFCVAMLWTNSKH